MRKLKRIFANRICSVSEPLPGGPTPIVADVHSRLFHSMGVWRPVPLRKACETLLTFSGHSVPKADGFYPGWGTRNIKFFDSGISYAHKNKTYLVFVQVESEQVLDSPCKSARLPFVIEVSFYS